MRRVASRELSGSGLDGALDLLTPPFAAAATRDVLPLVEGRFDVEGPRRHPAVLVRLKTTLARSAVVVRARVDGEIQPDVVFAAYSAAGSTLPLYVPQLPVGSSATGSFTVDVEVWHLDDPGAAELVHDAAAVSQAVTGPALSAGSAANLVEAVVLDGVLARLVYLSTLEKQRLIAVGREIAAGRHVGLARAAALDALGRDLSVPRLAGEADDDYRARLAIFSSWRLATPAGFAAALNGPGAAGDPNTGLPSLAGVTSRFRIVEQADQLAVAVRLVEVEGNTPYRERFQALLTGGLLFDLDGPPAAQLPDATRERLSRVRSTLDNALDRDGTDDSRYLTTLTATCLERAVRLLDLLTGDSSLSLLRAWTKDADPRHELGLGVTVGRLDSTRLSAAVDAARKAREASAAGEPVELPGGDGDVPADLLATILGSDPRDPGDDPLGAWLFTAAGMATVTAPDDDTLYLSPLPSFGLVIEGPEVIARGDRAEYTARLRQDESIGRHVLVDEAWQRAKAGVDALGGAGDPLTPEALRNALEALATANAALPPVLSPLTSAGLAPALPGEFAARILEAYDLDLLLGIPVADDPTGLDADSTEGQQLRDRMVARSDALTAAGFHSVRVLPAATGTGVLLLAALSVLPGGSNRPGEPPPAAYRWYVTELPAAGKGSGPLTITRGAGGRAEIQARTAGLSLLVCVAYVRRGRADPYEVRIELPGDEVLTLEQYGYVMNLLEHLCPLGIEINTFDLRRSHVSVDGGEPTFLSSEVSRSYPRFRRRRGVGPDRHPDPVLTRR
jgi:hypothetical protein